MARTVGNTEDELAALREAHQKWTIRITPAGQWVARRNRHLMETDDRIDLGFRSLLIEKTAPALRKQIEKQEELHKTHSVIL